MLPAHSWVASAIGTCMDETSVRRQVAHIAKSKTWLQINQGGEVLCSPHARVVPLDKFFWGKIKMVILSGPVLDPDGDNIWAVKVIRTDKAKKDRPWTWWYFIVMAPKGTDLSKWLGRQA